MTIQIDGRAYPPLSSQERLATLLVEDGTATLSVAESAVQRFTLDELGIEAPLGNAARQITFPDGELFWTEDREAVARLERELKITRLSGWEALRPRLILFAAFAFVGAWAIWRLAVPIAISIAVELTPDPLRDAIDTGTVQAMDKLIAEETGLTDTRQIEVQGIFSDLLREADIEESEFTLLFRDMPGLGPNALALPGGTIIVTDELVQGFPDPSVVAGVLAHEIGHVDHDHGLKQVYRSLGLYVTISLIAGDTGPLLEDALLEGGLLLSLTYSRDAEREADLFGLELADAAGFDPEGLLAFFDSLPDADETESGWGSTHPASGERIETIRQWLADR